MKKFTQDQLFDLYVTQQKTPYEIGAILGCEHKTVRKYLKEFGVPLRSPSEYNFLAKKSHTSPTQERVFEAKSMAAHVSYLCEGWHTSKTDSFYFCNQDANLIDLNIWMLTEVYQVKRYRLSVAAASEEAALEDLSLYSDASFNLDSSRKNPIFRLRSGGRVLAREVIENAYLILRSFSS